MILTIILQAGQVVDKTFWEKAAEQSFVIILLLFGLAGLLKLYLRLDARLTKYIEEDRKEMTNIIQNNTNAFSQCSQIMEKNTKVMQRLEILHDKKEE